MATDDSWKLQDAKARFSELVRRARAGDPQHVTVHGHEAVVVVDPSRFEVRPKPALARTMADFIERSKEYRGLSDGVAFEQPIDAHFSREPVFDEDEP